MTHVLLSQAGKLRAIAAAMAPYEVEAGVNIIEQVWAAHDASHDGEYPLTIANITCHTAMRRSASAHDFQKTYLISITVRL